MPSLRGSVGGRAGLVTAIEVESPMNSTDTSTRLLSADSAATWALVLFVFSIIVLYFIL